MVDGVATAIIYCVKKNGRFWQHSVVSWRLNLGYFWTFLSELWPISSRRGTKTELRDCHCDRFGFFTVRCYGFPWQVMVAKINKSVFFIVHSFNVWCGITHMFVFDTGNQPEKRFAKSYKCKPALTHRPLCMLDWYDCKIERFASSCSD